MQVPEEFIEENKKKEPIGERLRAELIDWMTKNKIVSISLETDKHSVDISSDKLPSRIKPVLTGYGAIYVEDEEEKHWAADIPHYYG